MKPHVIDSVDAATRAKIARLGRVIVGRLNPPRTPVQAFHEFNQQQLEWFIGKLRLRAQSRRLDDVVDKLADHELLTIVLEEEED